MCFVSISLNISDNKPLLRMYTSTQLTYLMSSRYHELYDAGKRGNLGRKQGGGVGGNKTE